MRQEAWGGGLGPPLPQGLIAFERKTQPAALTSAGSAPYVYFFALLADYISGGDKINRKHTNICYIRRDYINNSVFYSQKLVTVLA